MTGKDILKDKKFIEAYDLVEEEAVKKLNDLLGSEDDVDSLKEITEEEAEKYERIADYKVKAQEFIETAYLYFNRLKEV